MRVYLEVGKRGFRRIATYRGATVAGVFTNTIFGFIQAYVMLAIFAQRDEVGGFVISDALTYVFVTQGFLSIAAIGGIGGEIATRIRSGDIGIDIYRPVDFLAYWLALDVGRALFNTLARGVPPFVVGALAFDLRLPASPGRFAAFLLAMTLAVVVSFAIRFIVQLVAFWTIDDRGAAQLLSVVQFFFSGFILPVNFFPGWLEAVARVLPFQAMLQLPIEIYLGTAGVVPALGVQVAWAAVLLVAGRAFVAAATRKVTVHGG